MEDLLIVSYDESRKDVACLTVSRKNGAFITVINVLCGEEAKNEYKRLLEVPQDKVSAYALGARC